MVDHLMYISDITPKTMPGWRAKIKVQEKPTAKLVGKQNIKLQKMVFMDSKGTKVQAVIWGPNIDLFAGRLLQSKYYYISNAHVKLIDPRYQNNMAPYQWNISNKTLIEECLLVEDPDFTSLYEFARFSKFYDYMKSGTTVDVIGIVLDMQPAKHVKTPSVETHVQEAIIVNDRESYPMMISFWGDFVQDEAATLYQRLDQHPIIAGFRLGVVAYNGLSVSTKASSSIMISPEIPEARELEIWWIIHAQITDSTGAVSACLFGEVAESVLSCTQQQLLSLREDPPDALLKEIFKETPTKEFLLKIQTAENHYTTPPSMRYSVYEATSSETLSIKVEGSHNHEKPSSSLQEHQPKRLKLVGQSSKEKQKTDSCKETMTEEVIQVTPPPDEDICNSSQDTVQP